MEDESIERIVNRLHSTATKSSAGAVCRASVIMADNSVSRPPLPETEKSKIYQRLYKTPTKASAGGTRCKSASTLSPPGLGLKLLPDIPGLESRFLGKEDPEGERGGFGGTTPPRADGVSESKG